MAATAAIGLVRDIAALMLVLHSPAKAVEEERVADLLLMGFGISCQERHVLCLGVSDLRDQTSANPFADKPFNDT